MTGRDPDLTMSTDQPTRGSTGFRITVMVILGLGCFVVVRSFRAGTPVDIRIQEGLETSPVVPPTALIRAVPSSPAVSIRMGQKGGAEDLVGAGSASSTGAPPVGVAIQKLLTEYSVQSRQGRLDGGLRLQLSQLGAALDADPSVLPALREILLGRGIDPADPAFEALGPLAAALEASGEDSASGKSVDTVLARLVACAIGLARTDRVRYSLADLLAVVPGGSNTPSFLREGILDSLAQVRPEIDGGTGRFDLGKVADPIVAAGPIILANPMERKSIDLVLVSCRNAVRRGDLREASVALRALWGSAGIPDVGELVDEAMRAMDSVPRTDQTDGAHGAFQQSLFQLAEFSRQSRATDEALAREIASNQDPGAVWRAVGALGSRSPERLLEAISSRIGNERPLRADILGGAIPCIPTEKFLADESLRARLETSLRRWAEECNSELVRWNSAVAMAAVAPDSFGGEGMAWMEAVARDAAEAPEPPKEESVTEFSGGGRMVRGISLAGGSSVDLQIIDRIGSRLVQGGMAAQTGLDGAMGIMQRALNRHPGDSSVHRGIARFLRASRPPISSGVRSLVDDLARLAAGDAEVQAAVSEVLGPTIRLTAVFHSLRRRVLESGPEALPEVVEVASAKEAGSLGQPSVEYFWERLKESLEKAELNSVLVEDAAALILYRVPGGGVEGIGVLQCPDGKWRFDSPEARCPMPPRGSGSKQALRGGFRMTPRGGDKLLPENSWTFPGILGDGKEEDRRPDLVHESCGRIHVMNGAILAGFGQGLLSRLAYPPVSIDRWSSTPILPEPGACWMVRLPQKGAFGRAYRLRFDRVDSEAVEGQWELVAVGVATLTPSTIQWPIPAPGPGQETTAPCSVNH